MLNIACVLKSGGEYQPHHVGRLALEVARNLTVPHRFFCLSDLPGAGYLVKPLEHNWSGWWSKIELFRPKLFDGPVLYLDLDTTITGNIDSIVSGHRFTVLENFWTPGKIGSGLMAWDADLSEIYRAFVRDPERAMRDYVSREWFGDQGFIDANSPIKPERWQTKFPGRVASYRKHCLKGVPRGTLVVCYGGKVRPWNTKLKELAVG